MNRLISICPTHGLGESLKVLFAVAITATFLLVTQTASAQLPTPGPELEIFKKDVGEWDCEIKFWADPTAEPEITKGTETSRMLGGFWMLVDFEGKMNGMDFKGHGTYGYDAEKKQYVGSWIDSLSPSIMQMTGSYDKETETITYTGEAPGMDGTMLTHTLATCYKGDKRVMSMHVNPKDGEKFKVMEITYSKKK
jgi:hypothetical protein